MRVIAGDIGGTKTLLQMLEVSPADRELVLERRYESALFPSFQAMLREFLTAAGRARVAVACFAVAGPVMEGKSELTNLNWLIERSSLQAEFGIGRVIVMNDFSAVALGVPLLRPEDLHSIQAGSRDASMPLAILGAGTGLGEAVVIPVGAGWRVIASEGGHADFGPRTEEEIELLRVLMKRYGHVSWERVVSGQGLVNIFTTLRELAEPSIASADDPDIDLPAHIAALASEGDDLARRTMQMFADAYGAEAGNLALKVLALGGVYLAGGIAAKNLQWLTDGRFLASFRAKGRFETVMAQFPIDVIMNPKVGLIGATDLASRTALDTSV